MSRQSTSGDRVVRTAPRPSTSPLGVARVSVRNIQTTPTQPSSYAPLAHQQDEEEEGIVAEGNAHADGMYANETDSPVIGSTLSESEHEDESGNTNSFMDAVADHQRQMRQKKEMEREKMQKQTQQEFQPAQAQQHLQDEDAFSHQPLSSASHSRRLMSGPHSPVEEGVKTVPSTPPHSGLEVETIPPEQPKKRLLDAGLAAMKKNLIPGICLQILALTIIIIYYSSASAQAAFARLASFKEQTGFGFSAVSTSIAGGFLPWLIDNLKKEYTRRKQEKTAQMTADLELGPQQPSTTSTSTNANGPTHSDLQTSNGDSHIMLTGDAIPLEPLDLGQQHLSESAALDAAETGEHVTAIHKPSRWAEGVFYTLFWAWKGVEVDCFYRLQAVMWGDGSSAAVIIPKVLFDQFVYNPPWGSPSVLGAYMWKDCNFDFKLWWSKFCTRHFWFWTNPECLISLWLVWCPACSMIYILPGPLQIPLFNIVLCFWSLILTMLSGGGK